MRKKILMLLLAVGVTFSALSVTGQAEGVVEINEKNFPDANFRNELMETFYVAEDGILTEEEIVTITNLYVSDCEISSLEGIQYLTSLEYLYCDGNKLTSLPELPENLAILFCNDNPLTSLQTLPSELESLGCNNCGLSSLPELPAGLYELECYGNELTSLPTLPDNLKYLDIGDNPLSTLPKLPNQLRNFSCDEIGLTQLPTLPDSLYGLSCSYNELTTISSLPKELNYLYCYNNSLTQLPELPQGIEMIDVEDNKLTSLPELPDSLEYIYCKGNLLTVLPELPTNLAYLNCRNNRLKELPKLPDSLSSLDCSGNQLTTLSGLPEALSFLNASDNRLTSVVFHSNNQLSYVDLRGNYLADTSAITGADNIKWDEYDVETDDNLYWFEPQKNKAAVKFGESDIYRIAGATRYETSLQTADALKEQLGIGQFYTVILADGHNFPDALAGSYLAGIFDAPILMANEKAQYAEPLRAYIKENLVPGGTIYVLGGTAAVPDSVLQGLSGYRVLRLDGANRYETNLKILNQVEVGYEDILVCTGTGFADSLSASATGKPILLVGKTLTEAQKAFLAAHEKNDYYIIGGTSAVSAKIEAELQQYVRTKRIAGESRYETSVLVAEEFFDNPEAAVLAYAKNFPDGLCGGPLAMTKDAPLILTATGKEAIAVTYAKRNGTTYGAVLGGNGLVSDGTVKNVLGNSTISAW